MSMTKEGLADIHGRVEEKTGIILDKKDKCSDCKYKKTCLMRNENKTWLVNS